MTDHPPDEIASTDGAARGGSVDGATDGLDSQRRALVSVGETLKLADGITVRVVEVRGGQVKLGIEAPRSTVVLRSEIAPGSNARSRARRVIRRLQEPRPNGGPTVRFKRSKMPKEG